MNLYVELKIIFIIAENVNSNGKSRIYLSIIDF